MTSASTLAHMPLVEEAPPRDADVPNAPQAAAPERSGVLGELSDDTDRLSAARGVLGGILLGSGLWIVLLTFVLRRLTH